jgi:ring-1,2-phenylacetyl-CoA epoxidase subunit PaaE
VVPQFRPVRIKDIRRETADCISIAFDIPEQWKEEFRFRQGQNITIRSNLGDGEIRRTYSICSSPLDEELRVAVKQVLSGRFSTFANQQLKKGDILEVLPPTGTFSTGLHPSHKKNYVAFAAGSGITPIISIIKTTLAIEQNSSFILFLGNKNRHSIIFKETLEALKNKYVARFSVHHILSREKTEAPLNEGRINAEKCSQFTRVFTLHETDEFFLCGPEEMIFSVRSFLEAQGIQRQHIHYELFTVPGQERGTVKEKQVPGNDTAAEQTSTVTVKVDGSTRSFLLPYESFSILDAALREGADLPYACKGGVCSSCRARLTEGSVEMDVNYSLEAEEIEAGFILTCQSHPRSEKVTVDFDLR